MQIFKKTHEKKLEIYNPISFSIDEIIESLYPGSTFVITDLFLYTITEDFSEIRFHLIINEKCVSAIIFCVKTEKFQNFYTKDIYRDLLKNNFDVHANELLNLKNLITM